MPTAAPVVIFDKSALEALSVDEAVWFGNFFSHNMTALFFVEVLGDLAKERSDQRDPEAVVARLAEKTPPEARANVFHVQLAQGELLGNPVAMRSIPVLGGGTSVSIDGQRGIRFSASPEQAMLQRWKARQFGREERELAMDWRRAVGSMNLNEIYIRFRSRAASLRTLEDAYQAARHIVEDYEQRSVVMERALHLAGLRPDLRHVALERWKEQSTPPLAFHAPYTAYLVKLDVFFSLAIGAGLIGKERPSNIVDFAYLYYLPFCQILVSQDKLHRTLAPIVMEGKKEFVWTPDLKTDLARLDAHYSTFPEDVRRQGVRVFAQEPPKTGEWLVSRLWDRFLPKWRSAESALPGMSADQRARAAELARRIAEAPGSGDAAEAETGSQDSDFMLIKHVVPRRVGKWNLYPPDA